MEGDPLATIGLYVVLVLVLVFLNGFFVAAEFAFVKVKSNRLDALAQVGNTKARWSKHIVGNLNAYLSACQLGITFSSLALGWIGEPAIARLITPLLQGILPDVLIHTISFILAFTLITALHITLGEQVPKTFAIRQSERVTLLTAAPMVLFYRTMFPFIWLLNESSNWMLRKAGVEPEAEHESTHTAEEIRLIVSESRKNGAIDENEYALVDNVFEFSATTAREIMIPRTEMVCLMATLSFEENRETAIREQLTRYPVCLPDKDNIIGYVHIKDILKSYHGRQDIQEMVRPLISIPESMPIRTLLRLMQKRKIQMALLIDEYGGTSGLVTMEDIIEEIVGDIQDEFDEEKPAIEHCSERVFSVDGLLRIEQVNAFFGLALSEDDYETIGGWLYAQVGMPPEEGQVVEFNGYLFAVEQVDHMRISRVTVKHLGDASVEDENTAAS